MCIRDSVNTGRQPLPYRSGLKIECMDYGVSQKIVVNNVTVRDVDVYKRQGLMRYLTWFTRPTVPVRYSNGHYGFLDGNPPHRRRQTMGTVQQAKDEKRMCHSGS